MSLLTKTPTEFVSHLRNLGIHRFYIATRQGKVTVSHNQLEELATFYQQDRINFNDHEGLFFQVSRQHDVLMGAFVHRTKRGLAQGGTRYWQYNTLQNFFDDGIRLSKGMSHKSALAGLNWGGGKGVFAHNPSVNRNDPKYREYIFKEYGKFVSTLKGCYYTAEDVGCTHHDMRNIFSECRFVTCIPQEVGGSGNPSKMTAQGVVEGMRSALEFDGETLKDKVVACQGIGNVSRFIVDYLVQSQVKKVIAWDINKDHVEQARQQFAGKQVEIHHVDLEGDFKMFSTPCDIFAPNAVGAILNDKTIPVIKAKYICGAANNQLENPITHDIALKERGITYCPDFLVNRMGIVNCADESIGYVNEDPFKLRHFSKDYPYSIHNSLTQIFEKSKKDGTPNHKLALEIAEGLTHELNPIFGHRGQKIIDSII